MIAKWIEGEGEKEVVLPEEWGEDGRKMWIEKLKKVVGKRRQSLRKLRKEQQKALIRETREQMRKRLKRPREKEIARLMGKRLEGTMAKSVRARTIHKRHPSAVQGCCAERNGERECVVYWYSI
jgi:hypothetical protein